MEICEKLYALAWVEGDQILYLEAGPFVHYEDAYGYKHKRNLDNCIVVEGATVVWREA